MKNEIRRYERSASRFLGSRDYFSDADIASIAKSFRRKIRKLEKRVKKYERRRKNMVTTFDKALVAFLVPVVVALLAHFGFVPGADFEGGLAAVLTGLLVWLVPNKE